MANLSASQMLMSTSNAGKFVDPCSHIPAAGKIFTCVGDGVHSCMSMANPGTPPHLKGYRKSANQEPGKMFLHWGKLHDQPPPQDQYFGRVNDYSDSAKALMSNTESTVFAERYRDLKEGGRPQAEPLGKSGNKFGVTLPPIVQEAEFKFGMRTNLSMPAKELIYPTNDPGDDDEVTHAMYVGTHGSFEAGEQKRRGYNWLAHGVDPTSFRFGIVEKKKEVAGASQALQPGAVQKTSIVRKEVEAYRDLTSEVLGKPRNHGYGGKNIPEDFAFGRKNKYDNWGALECMRGTYKEEQLQPDKDLGVATRVGFRNVCNDENRVFGVPTVRTDVPKPRCKRVTDFHNYGDEAKAQALIYPSHYADYSVHEEDFTAAYPKEDLFYLVNDAGLDLTEEDFEYVYKKAQGYSADGQVSVEDFRQAMADLDL